VYKLADTIRAGGGKVRRLRVEEVEGVVGVA
jgi:hypothetical protein